MVKIVVNNINSKIVGHLAPEVHVDLDRALSYRLKNARHIPSVKRGHWDGIFHLYNKSRGQSFYTGLMSFTREILKKHNVEFEIQDARVKPPQDLPHLKFEPPDDWGYEERDYQTFTIDRSVKFTRGILNVCTGGGKCLGKGTAVLMFDGTTKNVEDVIENDLLMGPDSKSRIVKSTVKGYGELYRVKQNNGDDFVCNDEHILCLQNTRKSTANEEVHVTASDYYKSGVRLKHHYKGFKVGVEFKSTELPIDPYWLGLWLGDGNSNSPSITTGDKEIESYLYQYSKDNKLDITISEGHGCKTYSLVKNKRSKFKKECLVEGCSRKSNSAGRCRPHYRLYLKDNPPVGHIKNPLKDSLSKLGVLRNKHIPNCYKVNSRESRLKLLAGLIDSDGNFEKVGAVSFSNSNKQLAEDVCWLARSLGFRSSLNLKKTSIRSLGYKGNSYSVRISGKISDIPVLLTRKQAGDKTKYLDIRYGIDVTPIGKGDYYGFEIDGDRKFLLGDFTVTHNTVMTTKIISEIKTSPFIFYVLTKDLMEQAYRTMSACLNEPIGRVGDGICDIQKINVCTIQTAMRALKGKSKIKISDYKFDEEDVWDEKPIENQAKLDQIKQLIIQAKGVYFDECVTGDSMLLTEKGEVRIDEIEKSNCKYVLSYDGINTVYNKIVKWMPKGVQDTIRLKYTNGEIKCTTDHLVYTSRGWVQAGEIVKGDKVLFASADVEHGSNMISMGEKGNLFSDIKTNWKTVLHITKYKKEEVYDIEVEDTHCFFANGILVHNCHHVAAKTCKEVLEASTNAYWRFGGSATPYREAGDEIMIQAMFGAKIVDISASYLIKRGVLVKPYIFMVPVDSEKGHHSYQKVYKHSIVDNKELNDSVAETANHLVKRGLSCLVLVQHYPQGNYIKPLIDSAEFVTGKLTTKNRTQFIDDLREGTSKVMIATSLADEGLDVPTLDSALLPGGGASSTRVNQRIGRTLRRDKEGRKDKAIVVIYEHNAKFLDKHAKKVRKILKREPEFVIIDSKGLPYICEEIDELLGVSTGPTSLFDV